MQYPEDVIGDLAHKTGNLAHQTGDLAHKTGDLAHKTGEERTNILRLEKFGRCTEDPPSIIYDLGGLDGRVSDSHRNVQRQR